MKAKITQSFLKRLSPEPRPFDVNDEDLRGFILRVEPSGKMSYFIRYRKGDGKWTRFRIGGSDKLTCAQARENAKAKLASVELGEDPGEKKRQAEIYTLCTYLDKFYEGYATSHYRSGKMTVQRIRSSFKWLLDTRLSDISLQCVQQWAEAQFTKGDLTGQSINKNLILLRAAFQRGVEFGHLRANPLAGIRKVKESPKVIVRYLTNDEEESLMTALDERETRIRAERTSHNAWLRERRLPEKPDLTKKPYADYLKPAIIVSLNTGLRRNELLTLQWADVSFDDSTIHVRSHAAKSGKPRAIPMNEAVFKTLRHWRSMNPKAIIVFPGPTGESMYDFRSSWGRILTEAKITNFRWHDMRHHFASRLVQSGVDLNVVRELMGHADMKMVLRYAHLDDAMKQNAVCRLDRPRGKVRSSRRPGRRRRK